jgi:hypothetical protein
MSLGDELAIISTEATSERDAGSDGENPSKDIGDSENASDNGRPMKICHTPFRERGNEASIRVPRMCKSHV